MTSEHTMQHQIGTALAHLYLNLMEDVRALRGALGDPPTEVPVEVLNLISAMLLSMAFASVVLCPAGEEGDSAAADILEWMRAEPVRGELTAAAAAEARHECLNCDGLDMPPPNAKEIGH